MKQFLIIFILFIFTCVAPNAFAHGGHNKEESKIPALEKPADSIYITEEKESDPLENSELFSPGDLFMQGEIVTETNEPMNMEGSHNENDDHAMPKVESSKHKVVETSSKGYSAALGITVFASLIFAGLTFLRPGE